MSGGWGGVRKEKGWKGGGNFPVPSPRPLPKDPIHPPLSKKFLPRKNRQKRLLLPLTFPTCLIKYAAAAAEKWKEGRKRRRFSNERFSPSLPLSTMQQPETVCENHQMVKNIPNHSSTKHLYKNCYFYRWEIKAFYFCQLSNFSSMQRREESV